MSKLIVFTYDAEQKAEAVLEKVQELTKQSLIVVQDAAWIVKDASGKVRVQQTLENYVKGGNVVSGGFWGLLVGFLFGGPLFGALLGIGLGAIFGSRIDVGIDNSFIKEVGDDMMPNTSALFLLAVDVTVDKVGEALGEFGGNVYHTSLSNEAEETFRKALENEEIATAVEAHHSDETSV